MVARVAGELLERADVFPEAAAPQADARAQEVRAEPVVEPDAARDVDDVGADELADVRDLVDEADTRRQEGVRGELDHLRRVHVGAYDRGRRFPGGARRRGRRRRGRMRRRRRGPGCMKSATALPSARNSGIGDVADVREAARVETRAHCSPVPTGTVLFMTSTGRPGTSSGSSSTTVQTARQVGVARLGRRRADRDEEELGAVHRLVDVEREAQTAAVPRDQLVEPGLVDRHLARARSRSIRSGTMSRTTTSCPRSAKHAPVTRPT